MPFATLSARRAVAAPALLNSRYRSTVVTSVFPDTGIAVSEDVPRPL